MRVILSSSYVRRVFLRLMVASLVLLAGVVPSLAARVTREVEHSRSPLETEEETHAKYQDVLVNSHRRMRHRLVSPKPIQWTKSQRAIHLSYIKQARPSYLGVEGHHFSNGLLAPLTC